MSKTPQDFAHEYTFQIEEFTKFVEAITDDTAYNQKREMRTVIEAIVREWEQYHD